MQTTERDIWSASWDDIVRVSLKGGELVCGYGDCYIINCDKLYPHTHYVCPKCKIVDGIKDGCPKCKGEKLRREQYEKATGVLDWLQHRLREIASMCITIVLFLGR